MINISSVLQMHVARKNTLEAKGLWQNSTAVKLSIQMLQQSSKLQSGSVAAKACCLDSLFSERVRLYSQYIFVLRATTCNGSHHTEATCPDRAKRMARVWPDKDKG